MLIYLLRSVLKVTGMLMPILGISWALGYLFISAKLVVFAYLFNIANGFQVCTYHMFIIMLAIECDQNNIYEITMNIY